MQRKHLPRALFAIFPLCLLILNRTYAGSDADLQATLAQQRLSRVSPLNSLSTANVASLLWDTDPLVKVSAISELRRRGDRSYAQRISVILSQTRVATKDLRFDPHGYPSPPAALLAIGFDYLALQGDPGVLSELIARPEVWAVPVWFTNSFKSMHPGWMSTLIAAAKQRSAPGVAAFLIAASATQANVPELAHILNDEQGLIWKGAVEAAERLDDPILWDGIDRSLASQPTDAHLHARLAEFRRARINVSVLLDAAGRTLDSLENEDSNERALIQISKLIEFVRLSQARHEELPYRLRARLLATRSRGLISALGDTW